MRDSTGDHGRHPDGLPTIFSTEDSAREADLTKNGPWPERELRQHPTALGVYKELCRKCDQSTLNWQLQQLVNPSCRTLDSWSRPLKAATFRLVLNRAKRLKQEIEQLRHTPHIYSLVSDGKIQPQDLLHPLCNLDEHFRGLLSLDKFARGFGPRQQPDFNEILDGLVRYVRHKFGRPKYREIETVLDGLGVKIPNLKQWRWDHQHPKRKTNPPKSRR